MQLFKLLGTIAIDGTEQARNELDGVVDKGQDAESKLVSSFRNIGNAVISYFAVDKIISFGQAIVSASAEVSAEQSAFAQIMTQNAIGDYADTAMAKLEELAKATGVMSTRLTPYMTSMTAKFKGLGYDIETATDFAVEGLNLASDASAFWDMSLDESMSHLNSFINGSYEGGEAIGLFANETQLASYAIKTGLIEEKKEWASLEESIKQATRLEYAKNMFGLSGAVGQANKESEQYANTQANLTEKWRQFKALIGEPLLQNVVTPAMNVLGETIDKLTVGYQDLTTWIANNQDTLNQWKGIIEQIVTTIGIATASFVAFKTGAMIQGVVNSFQQAQITLALFTSTTQGMTVAQGFLNGTLTLGETIVGLFTGKITLMELATALATKAQAGLNAVLSANPIGIVIALLVALTGAFVVAYNKSETFRNFINKLWETAKTSFTNLVNTVMQAWENIKKSTVEAWNTVKSIVQVGLMFISELVNFFVDILLIPWNFIWQNFGAKITEAWNNIKTKVSEGLTNISTKISDVMNSIYTKVSNIWNSVKTATTNVFNSIKSFISGVWDSVSTSISNKVNDIYSRVSSVFNSVKSTVSSVFDSIRSIASSIWNSIKSAIETPINNAKNTVANVIERIKGLFNFSWSLPKLKLPHVTISGKFSLTPPSVPSFGISWYKKAMDDGMILDKPTIFGFQNGNFLGGGEAGSETVVGTQSLMDMIKNASGGNNAELLAILNAIYELLKDGDRLYDVIVKALSDGSFSVVLDGREVGRLVRKYA